MWEEIAIQYKEELNRFISNIELAQRLLESRTPKSFKRAVRVVENAIDSAYFNAQRISMEEPTCLPPSRLKPVKEPLCPKNELTKEKSENLPEIFEWIDNWKDEI